MRSRFPRYPGTKEQLKAENEMMKKKLIEKGAEFGENNFLKSDNAEEIENRLLKNVLEYEKQFETAKKIRIFDKIEKPTHFRPAALIPDSEIDSAWEKLLSYLHKYSIDLDVCSPAVTNRELYRFTIEELFYHEMDDINVDGMITCFVYDEFHPDPIYDNTVAATEYCMKYILDKEPMKWMHRFIGEKLRLNGHPSLKLEELKEKINNYKNRYDNVVIRKLANNSCTIIEDKCLVTGIYAIHAIVDTVTFHISGNWKIHFEPNPEFGHWNIVGIEIEGIDF